MEIPFWELPCLSAKRPVKRFSFTLGDPGFFKHRELYLIGQVTKFSNIIL